MLDWKDRRSYESVDDYIDRLYSEIGRMEDKFTNLIVENSDLRESLKDTKNDYEQLKKDYAKLSANPYFIDALQKECNELRGRNASLENIKAMYDSLFKKYNALEKKYNVSNEHSKALQHVINDIDRDSSCGNCMYKNYYYFDSKENHCKELENNKSSVGYRSYEELHADVEKFISTELGLKRDKREKLPTIADHLIDEAVEKYEFLKGLLTLVFFISPIVLSWNYGAIYLLLFIPLLVVRLLPSEETVEAFLVEYYKRKENE